MAPSIVRQQQSGLASWARLVLTVLGHRSHGLSTGGPCAVAKRTQHRPEPEEGKGVARFPFDLTGHPSGPLSRAPQPDE